MDRIQASERTRERLKALLDGRGEATDERSELVRLAARLIVEEGLEAEATDAVGRGYYEHGAASGRGYRNGYDRGVEERGGHDRIQRAADRRPVEAVPLEDPRSLCSIRSRISARWRNAALV